MKKKDRIFLTKILLALTIFQIEHIWMIPTVQISNINRTNLKFNFRT